MAASLGLCFAVTPYFILIGILPLLLMESLGVSIGNYAFYQGSIVGLFSALSFSTPWILSHFNLNTVVRYSILASTLSLSLAFILSLFVPDSPLLITGLMWVYVLGIVIPPTMMFVRAMEMFGHLRGCASSLIQSLRMLSMSVGTALAGALYDGSFRPVALVMLLFMFVAVPLMVMVFRKHSETDMLAESMPSMH